MPFDYRSCPHVNKTWELVLRKRTAIHANLIVLSCDRETNRRPTWAYQGANCLPTIALCVMTPTCPATRRSGTASRGTAELKPAQQLRLLGGEFLIAENSLAVQISQLLDGREDVGLPNGRLGTRRVLRGGDAAAATVGGVGAPSSETIGRLARSTRPNGLENVSDPP